MFDTIAAVATPSGKGGVAIIRLSGENALQIAKRMFSPLKTQYIPNRMYAGDISGEGFTDYGFMVYFKAPKSFTGEDVVEFHCHGGTEITRGLLKKAFALGARSAERGEFTRRAFLNGKLSLASAEGMADMINAESLALLRAGNMLYNERLTSEIKSVQDDLKLILAQTAVEIDYPEEDESGANLRAVVESINALDGRLGKLVSSYKCGKKIKDGVTVALCGKPNTGKSSLLNALVGYEKAIVSPEAGTTRDAVEGTLEMDGVKYNLIDTAGIRENAGAVESIGITRAKNVVASADVVLFVTDGGELNEKTSGEVVRVFNKTDILTPCGEYDVAVSAKTGEGLEELKAAIKRAGVGDAALDKLFVVEERHYSALIRAAEALRSAAENADTHTLDMIAVDLRDAWDALGEITGETATEEIISTVFEKFCVGK